MTTKKKTTPKTLAAAKQADAPTVATEQLDWSEPIHGEVEETQKLTPLQLRNLPPVESSVHAQNLKPNCACPLTPGCKGKITVYSSIARTQKDENGNPIKHVREQYVKCTKCGRAPVNPRRTEQSFVDTKLFDRRAKRTSDSE